ncbi:MAG: GNAT family N-acetyltransferase [Leeuwenhoekiella sp.]
MRTLKGQKCYLRALEPTDIDLLISVENNERFWHLSNTLAPFSEYTLNEYLANAHRDIYEIKQLRLVICMPSNEAIGFIDLFDFDPKNKRAGLGILIDNEENRSKGFGQEAIALLLKYCFTYLDLHQVFANILEDNKGSIKLFEKLGFKRTGTKKDWHNTGKTFKTEFLYQYIDSCTSSVSS